MKTLLQNFLLGHILIGSLACTRMTPEQMAALEAQDRAVAAAQALRAGPIESDKPLEVRGVRFGMSPEQVKKLESSKPEWEKKVGSVVHLAFEDSLSGKRALVVYHFVDNKMFELDYKFTTLGGCSESKPHALQLVYDLQRKYGKDGVVTLNHTFPNSCYHQTGMALYRGQPASEGPSSS